MGAGAALLLLIVYLGREHLGELDRIARASPVAILAILLLYMASRFLSGEIMRLSLRRLDVHTGVLESFLVTIVVTYTNFLIPHAGWGGPAIYFKRKYGLSLAAFGSLMLPLVVLQVATIGIVGLVCWILTFNAHPPGSGTYIVAAVFLACAVGGLAPLFLRVPVFGGKYLERISSFLRRLGTSWSTLASSHSTVLIVLAVQLIVLLLRTWRLEIALQAVGQDAPFIAVLMMSLLADIMLLVSITPSGLGLREAAIAFGASLFQVPMDMAIAAAVLDRVVWMVGVILVAQIGLWSVMRTNSTRQE